MSLIGKKSLLFGKPFCLHGGMRSYIRWGFPKKLNRQLYYLWTVKKATTSPTRVPTPSEGLWREGKGVRT